MKWWEIASQKNVDECSKMRAKNISNYFLNFSVYFRPWLHELTTKYKERGIYPPMASWLLPSYYTEKDDIEVATYAAMLIRDDENVIDRVNEFRNLLGEHPYGWFKERQFISLSIGKSQLLVTGGVRNYKIAEYFSKIYDEWKGRRYVTSLIFAETFGADHYFKKLQLLMLVLGTCDGIGKGIWSVSSKDLRCPITKEVLYLLRTFFPDYKKVGDYHDAIKLFGFKVDTDFFYAALAYKDLQGTMPKECSRLANLYNKRYKECNANEKRDWLPYTKRGILPKI